LWHLFNAYLDYREELRGGSSRRDWGTSTGRGNRNMAISGYLDAPNSKRRLPGEKPKREERRIDLKLRGVDTIPA